MKSKEFDLSNKQEQEKNRLMNDQAQEKLKQEQFKQEIYNIISPSDLKRRIAEILPQIAQYMPKIQELKTLNFSSRNNDGFSLMTNYLAKILEIADNFGIKIPRSEKVEEVDKGTGE